VVAVLLELLGSYSLLLHLSRPLVGIRHSDDEP